MGLRDRIQSAITGLPAPTESGYRRRPQAGPPAEVSRPGQRRASSATSTSNPRFRASRLAIEGDSGPSAQSRFRSGQPAIQKNSTSTSSSTSSSQQNGTTVSGANLASTRPPPRTTASTPVLPLTRISRSYGNNDKQESFSPNPSRRLALEGSGCTPDSCSTAASRITNRANLATTPKAKESEEGDQLAPLSEREIIDVSDETSLPRAVESAQGQIRDGVQQPVAQQATRTTIPSPPISMLQQKPPLTRTASSGRTGNPNPASTSTNPSKLGAPQPISQPPGRNQPPERMRTGSSGPPSMTKTSNGDTGQPQALYLGAFDMADADQSAQQRTPTTRGGPTQRGTRSRSSDLGQRRSSSRSSTSTHRTTVLGHGSWFPRPLLCRDGSFNSTHRPYYDSYWDSWGYHYPFDAPPWYPTRYVLPHLQTTFTEVSTNYFEHESPATPDLDTTRGSEVINRYYNGWRDAYTEALSGSCHAISAADRARILANRDGLRSRQDEAIRRLTDGDQAVVRETLDQVRVDRQMAVDMPLAQFRWATPWIKEVWVKEHGEIPG
ncbi:hypothetical protein EPUS_05115 [Endocarpon pusillum Z07020]|uniref:Uncharacterized protein n=1 Tax=Endocarpon pusillum (strain Z07020 / HMAS-L-300199) TaxID=1263415 RepID=U1GF92_ENDPU|nr:uncharacterized protein EPUS_05115 [Endocarpon pusillum Z07020]ERF70763.1 hypothetical protein EPUS_05115 [Endocarpon pusillum Z07020]